MTEPIQTKEEISQSNSVSLDMLSIVGALWCVECKEFTYANRVYLGMSLCEEHFKEAKIDLK